MKHIRRLIMLAACLGLAGLIYIAIQPPIVQVDVASVGFDRLRVTIDEDGKTRIRERYVVSAPVAGRLSRIDIDPGATVRANATVLAVIEPSDPQLLNPRELATAEAREKAAEATLKQTEPQLQQARADLDFAESELARQQRLDRVSSTSQSELENAERVFRLSQAAYRSATFAAEVARFEYEQAQAALMPSRTPQDVATSDNVKTSTWRFELRAPIDGKVLRVLQESSAVVAPGTPLLEVGNPHDLELEIDVLSSDAVKISSGDKVIVKHWGGEWPLLGVVKLVEPSAFTKTSALGVEEQRVNVIADLLDPVDRRPSLGDGFRVEASVVIWEEDHVLTVPGSALFRVGDKWFVFLHSNGKAIRQRVTIGRKNAHLAEVLQGLNEHDWVIVHPGDQIVDGAPVKPRNSKSEPAT